MKVKALANLSGKTGDKSKGDEFTVGAVHGRELVERGLVVEVETASAPKTVAASRATAKPRPAADTFAAVE